ncbi:ATP-dependent Clp protease proteolytic subunit [Glycine soja]|uniref:ATP-dependent Clp protease proteolytic subunit n=1 Tax=Glycine soja TaxID=3848 RepID=A0A445LJF3_GLYSO|nr:ATP-dependent Clp protease proteolytic subunit [Glycine soja]
MTRQWQWRYRLIPPLALAIRAYVDTKPLVPLAIRATWSACRKSNWRAGERVMIHQPASSFYEAQTGEFILEAEELLKMSETITRVYVQRTGKPLWVISEDMEMDVFMLAAEAQSHGIVDLVAVE